MDPISALYLELTKGTSIFIIWVASHFGHRCAPTGGPMPCPPLHPALVRGFLEMEHFKFHYKATISVTSVHQAMELEKYSYYFLLKSKWWSLVWVNTLSSIMGTHCTRNWYESPQCSVMRSLHWCSIRDPALLTHTIPATIKQTPNACLLPGLSGL